MRRFFIIITKLIIIQFCVAQDIDQTKLLADRYFSTGDYESALNLYKRVLFFDSTNDYLSIHNTIADCYYVTGNYEKALFHYDISYNIENNDSIKNEFLLKRVLILCKQKSFIDARQEIFNLTEDSGYFYSRKEFYLGIIELESFNIETSKAHFLNAVDTLNKDKTKAIEDIFSTVDLKKPNSKTAKILSLFLPGAGQFYAKDYKNSANSFIINASLATLFFIIARNYTFLDATLSVFPWFQRYYMGGFQKAGLIAKQKREEKKQLLIKTLIKEFNKN